MKKGLISIILANILYASPGYSFDKVVSFGDSLSDGGVLNILGLPSRYIAGNDSLLYNEILSKEFTGQDLKTSIEGGTNYSIAGSTAGESPLLIYRTKHQIENYLNDNEGKADKNSMYLYWIGANDISSDVEFNLLQFKFKKIFNEGENYQLSTAPQDAASQVDTLLQRGAGLVVVPNLPNAGLSPWTATALFGFSQLLFGGNLLDLPSLYAKQDYAMRQQGDVYGEEQRQAAIINSLSDVLGGYGLNLPKNIIGNVYKTLLSMEQRLTNQFNYDLEQGLSALNGNIALMNINGLFQEIVDDPLRYGFHNILVPICQIGVPAPLCNENQPSWHSDQVYLFSDWFHPSPEAHVVIAQYITSVINAPVNVSRLIEPTKQSIYSHNSYLTSQLSQLRVTKDLNTKYQLFGGYNGHLSTNSSNHDLSGQINLGVLIRPNEYFGVGAALSAGKYTNKLTSDFRTNYDNKMMSLFAEFAAGGGWLNTQISVGNIDFTKIKRSLTLGTFVRSEFAQTKASTFSTSVNTGYDFVINDFIQHGPNLSLLYRHSKINGYSEKSDSSSAMAFSKQKFSDTLLTAGWHLGMKNSVVNPFLELNYLKPLGNNKNDISSHLKSTKTSFSYQYNANDQASLNAKLGATYKINQSSSAFTTIDMPNIKRGSHNLYYMAGINFTF